MQRFSDFICCAALILALGSMTCSCVTEDLVPADPGLTTPSGVGSAATHPLCGDSFWPHWGDGRAELCTYAWTFPRYGELRHGRTTSIVVTETFSDAQRVKIDPPAAGPGDAGGFPVLKLNLIQEMQTGIYSYNMMTSTFLAVDPAGGRAAGSPTKISFSSQEWCGHVYQQLIFHPRSISQTIHSYFDGEADRSSELTYPRPALTEDALLLWARRLASPPVEPGQEASVALLPSLRSARLGHQELEWQEARLSRAAATDHIEVPAGTFEVRTARVAIDGGATWEFAVEVSPPHRIISWQVSTGERAELLGTDRLAYWQLNGEGDEIYLERLGGSGGPTD